MSRASKACEFPQDVRQKIKARDGSCIFCRMYGYSGFPPTQIAHYVPRSKLGLGIEENGAWVCVKHHMELDNGVNSEPYKRSFREYMESKYENWEEIPKMYSKWR